MLKTLEQIELVRRISDDNFEIYIYKIMNQAHSVFTSGSHYY